jgi:hypothetical protein
VNTSIGKIKNILASYMGQEEKIFLHHIRVRGEKIIASYKGQRRKDSCII